MAGQDDIPDDGSVYDDCVGIDEVLTAEDAHAEPLAAEKIFPIVHKDNEDAFKKVVSEFAIAERRMKRIEWMDGVEYRL